MTFRSNRQKIVFWVFKYVRLYCLTLSLRRGGLLQPPPFRIFPRAVFAFSLRLPYGPFTHPFSRYPCINEKNFQQFFPRKKLGAGGLQQPPRPEKEGVAAKINKFL